MDKFNVALLQLAPQETIEKTLLVGSAACRQAKERGADLAIFPELWHIGYDITRMSPHYAIDQASHFFQQHIALAEELQLAIAVTYLGHGSHKPQNKLALIDKTGDVILDYAKIHLCDFKEAFGISLKSTEKALEPGQYFQVVDLNYGRGSVKIGAMICFDREFPESARVLALQGAEIIITPNASTLQTCSVVGDARIAAFRTRAFENLVGAVMVNYPAPACDGHSCVFGVDSHPLYMAGCDEEVGLCEFNLEFLRYYRRHEMDRFRNRQPNAYRSISAATTPI